MFSALVTRLRGLRQRARASREMDDELRFHVEMETEAHITRGVPPLEARRLAFRYPAVAESPRWPWWRG